MMKTRFLKIAAVGLLLASGGAAMAQTNTPVVPIDTSLTYTALSSPFNAAIVWVVGATACLMVFKWIKRAVTK